MDAINGLVGNDRPRASGLSKRLGLNLAAIAFSYCVAVWCNLDFATLGLGESREVASDGRFGGAVLERGNGLEADAGQRARADVKARVHGARAWARAGTASTHRAVPYSITSSARKSNVGGRSRPRAFAVFRLITSSYLVGRWKGSSPGLAPFNTRSRYPAARRNISTMSIE